ncbi:hypothetical protein [Variovorax sp. RCC_210]|uniref:hypothetical protein n=1 Tax=Variovorax sp. RCC_210 TaxID=3239217 RepID=UPI0035241158
MRLLPRLCATSLLLLTLAFTAPAPADAQPVADVQRLADVPYGPDAAQRMDVYLPKPAQHATEARGAPVLVMVHGGA